MGDERTLKAYEKVVAAGMYDTTRAALHRGQDHVRQLWEDQVTRMTLGRFLRPFIERERPTGSIRVIDLGCGTGEGIRVLSQLRHLPERFTLTEPDLLFSEGLQFYRGVDLSPSMVAKARERYGAHPKLEFEIADLQDGLPVVHWPVGGPGPARQAVCSPRAGRPAGGPAGAAGRCVRAS